MVRERDSLISTNVDIHGEGLLTSEGYHPTVIVLDVPFADGKRRVIAGGVDDEPPLRVLLGPWPFPIDPQRFATTYPESSRYECVVGEDGYRLSMGQEVDYARYEASVNVSGCRRERIRSTHWNDIHIKCVL